MHHAPLSITIDLNCSLTEEINNMAVLHLKGIVKHLTFDLQTKHP
jgi:hypothetical protein